MLWNISVSIPSDIHALVYWIYPHRFLPETIPWLVANGKLREADRVIKQIAKFNKVQMPDHVFTESDPDLDKPATNDIQPTENGKKQSFLNQLRSKMKKEESADEEHAVKYTLMDVLRHRKLCLYAFLMCGLWYVTFGFSDLLVRVL